MKVKFFGIISLLLSMSLITPVHANELNYAACKQFSNSIMYFSPGLDGWHREHAAMLYQELPVDFRSALHHAGVKVYSFSEEESGFRAEKYAGTTFLNQYRTITDGYLTSLTIEVYAEIYNPERCKLYDEALIHEIGHCFDETYNGGLPCTGHAGSISDMHEWREIMKEEIWEISSLNRMSKANCYNPAETFAEAFVGVIQKPMSTAKKCPKSYTFIIKRMMDYIEYHHGTPN